MVCTYVDRNNAAKFTGSKLNSSCQLGATLVRSASCPKQLKRFEDKEFTEDFKYFFLTHRKDKRNITKAP